MGRENKKNSSLTIRLECKTKEDLKKAAKNRGLTVSEMVNNLILDQLERENFKKINEEQFKKRTVSFEEKLIKLKEKMKWGNS